VPTSNKTGTSRLAVFRVDASPNIGTGHAMRSLTLAGGLAASGWRIAFAVAHGTARSVPSIASSGYSLLTLERSGLSEAAALAEHWPEGAQLLVVDSYSHDARFETACRPWADRILVIDDLADRPHDADILLDPTPCRAHSDYASLLKRKCTLLLGPAYALLSPCFSERRAASLARRSDRQSPARILVAFGGSDPRNATSLVLRGLDTLDRRLEMDVVLGAAAAHRQAVLDLAKSCRVPVSVSVDLQPETMADLLARADMAFGSIGTSMWERCCLGVPSVVITTAANQHPIADILQRLEAIRYVGDIGEIGEADVAREAWVLFAAPSTTSEIGKRAAALCDGRGLYRVTAAVDPPLAKDGKPIMLRPATESDCALLLEWQRHPRLRVYAKNPAAPSEGEHRAWLAARLADNDCLLNIVLHGECPVGAVRLDRETDPERGELYEISIYVTPDQQRRGIATGALAATRMLVPENNLKAVVLPGNKASEALFRKAGYIWDDGFFVNPARRRLKA